ncbi:hypothetical protein JCM14244_16750 [Venenivibrio stagnispumantis]|uniref:Uncharacterized protein n=1 Tax=Venenivibrio stagnispumantis TaxID=407998 RepID=A0AA45WQ29_9AQUI|nr:hypothetical protein [Venenivibrio stagnispumantis]MCW4573549.1 hypothetical protein [Venenivibrio stagnispumantis]SMP23658.1 hypothetical protein SAMN06264868_13011 [Venenivibrio stagnispumantis]
MKKLILAGILAVATTTFAVETNFKHYETFKEAYKSSNDDFTAMAKLYLYVGGKVMGGFIDYNSVKDKKQIIPAIPVADERNIKNEVWDTYKACKNAVISEEQFGKNNCETSRLIVECNTKIEIEKELRRY